MNSASAIKFLYAAYVATWLIHALYLAPFFCCFRRVTVTWATARCCAPGS